MRFSAAAPSVWWRTYRTNESEYRSRFMMSIELEVL
jgi:hypothetical protein